jgi:transcriptional antiterminator RfaH
LEVGHVRTDEHEDRPDYQADWAVASTQPHRELTAIQNLDRQGFKNYCPMISKRIRHARKWQDVRRPLFPGYVFIALEDTNQQWRPILSTYGIKQLICHGNRPSILDKGFVECLQDREKNGVVTSAEHSFKNGQLVRLNRGPFDGLTATIIELDQKSRITVLLNMLNGQIKVKVPVGDVLAV